MTRYQTDPDQFLWQGINTVALLDHAEKDRIYLDPGLSGHAQEQ